MEHTEIFKSEEYQIKYLLLKPGFQRAVIAARKAAGIPKEGFADNKADNAWKEKVSSSQLADLELAIYRIIDDFELSERWFQGLTFYIKRNSPGLLRVQPLEQRHIYVGKREEHKLRAVLIKVDAATTQRELIEAFKKIKEYLPKRVKKQLPPYVNHAIRAKELKKPAIKWREVADQINKEFKANYDENSIRKKVELLEQKLRD